MLRTHIGFSSVSRSDGYYTNIDFWQVFAAAKSGLKGVSEDMERCLSLVCAHQRLSECMYVISVLLRARKDCVWFSSY